MEGPKKIGVIALLLVVIVGAALLMHRTLSKGTKPPTWVGVAPVEMIDSETLEFTTLPSAEWDKLGREGNRFKSPKTGKYTLCKPAICRECGEKIPMPALSEDAPPEKVDEIVQSYKCPKCGHLAFLDPAARRK